ncbi:hypothetical protein [Corynebacterium pygosceleis]|uniref:Uncharacterized protein n=1 Tax=Corynebacterium pygosceleis TaxID=2800406 RepID=A0A9Q4CA26_9CORY|nr:hypothetical protein [Corynebacterium pygosceleis]MCX7445438.1 hypothetical protein [Corynebacterium pygosceleis]MCX7469066.1 hypothetical protein [Corynebacterium pygosceleis]
MESFSNTLTSFSTDGGVLKMIFDFLAPFADVASGVKSLLGLV